MENKKSSLSTIWIFVTLNYLYCDLIGLMDSSLLKQYLTGNVDGLAINENFLLYAGILMEIPIAMVLLSRVLRKNMNCWANIMAGSLKTIVMIITLFMGSVTKYYIFFASIEIATTLFIVGYAIKWLRQKEV
ncbi:hypothetical protein GVN20_14255 [Runella sp. CRIBMP]|uniref:DUF6326 family protein n=1 Tax=Runella sp. CRIBMP TaxID=2683261 RepID=UPI0014128D08|nr:DUF6326 family protein [Runella sp. CRIBMP]NBB20526.1 hypothetical protein [Runella sp. CRIBMP]